jgi:Flp pilus assembly protein TadD
LKPKHLLPVLVVAFGLLAYANSFRGPFILDDVLSITDNPTIRRLWPIWVPLSPPHRGGLTVEGRPLVNLSMAINYAFGGLDARGYHVFNLLIHIAAGLALLGVVRRTLLQPRLRERFGGSASELALAVAILWTVHPLLTESVTYVVQRAESLMGLFYLLTLYCFIRSTPSRVPRVWHSLCVGACLMGMASKEVMVSAPVIVLLYDWMFVAGNFRDAWARRRRLYVALAGTWLVLGYLVAVTHIRSGTAGFGSKITWWSYGLTQCRAIVLYIGLSVWPHPLVFDYGTDVAKLGGEVLVCALVVTALAVATGIGLWRRHPVAILGVWFFATLAPSSSVVPVVTQTMAEHRMYLPLAAVVVVVTVGGFEFGRHFLSPHRRARRLLNWGLSSAVVVTLGLLTIQRNRDYRSLLTIWQDTVDKRPTNPRAQYNLGTALAQSGKLAEAVEHLAIALRFQPDMADAHYNMGRALVQLGTPREAIGHLEQVLQFNPNDANAQYELGNALLAVGRLPEAVQHWQQAVQIRPDYADARNNLGAAFAQAGRFREAAEQFGEVLRITPGDAQVYFNLANVLLALGNTRDAIANCEHALEIQPDFPEARNTLTRLLAALGSTSNQTSQQRE